jgi:hypothetical protein
MRSVKCWQMELLLDSPLAPPKGWVTGWVEHLSMDSWMVRATRWRFGLASGSHSGSGHPVPKHRAPFARDPENWIRSHHYAPRAVMVTHQWNRLDSDSLMV